MADDEDQGDTPVTMDTEPIGPGTDPQARDSELYRMAAFRIREAANRIATLANASHDETLQRQLLAVCERLVDEERALLALTAK